MKDVDRPGAVAEAAQAVRDGLAGERARLARRVEDRAPEGQLRREHRGVRAARSVCGAVGMALARDLDDRRAGARVEEQIDRLLAMASGQHDGARPEREHRPCERARLVVLVVLVGVGRAIAGRLDVGGQHARLGQVGGDDRCARDDLRHQRALGVGLRAGARPTRRP